MLKNRAYVKFLYISFRRILVLKNKLIGLILSTTMIVALLTGCGKEVNEIDEFGKEIDTFCSNISKIDNNINKINAESDDAVSKLLGYLDELDNDFRDFSNLDFPEEFDYLESLADEASEYMTTAVESYHEAYTDDSYNSSLADYASQNYSRAYKRIQIIVTFLHGEQPDDVEVTTAPPID